MDVIEVFADISCPFAHVGLHRFVLERTTRGLHVPRLRVRAWPLEIVNGVPLAGPDLAPKVRALRATVAPDLFGGFKGSTFPATTLPALAAEAAAHGVDAGTGEAFSLAIRHALFEDGLDIADLDVLGELRREHGVPACRATDDEAVLRDLADGRRRGVIGSPHFFTAAGGFFCPSLHVLHREHEYDVRYDDLGFERFADAAFV